MPVEEWAGDLWGVAWLKIYFWSQSESKSLQGYLSIYLRWIYTPIIAQCTWYTYGVKVPNLFCIFFTPHDVWKLLCIFDASQSQCTSGAKDWRSYQMVWRCTANQERSGHCVKEWLGFLAWQIQVKTVTFHRPEPGWSSHGQDEAWVIPSGGPNPSMLKNRGMSCG